MAYRGAPETWAWLRVSRTIDLWHAQAQRPASSSSSPLPLSPLRAPPPHYRLCVRQPPTTTTIHGFGYLRWKHLQNLRGRGGRKGWLCRATSQARQRLGLHTSALCLNTSTGSRWSAGLSQYMARFRNTLDSVSKAVSAASGSTQAELLSKISRLKPNASQQLSKEVETGLEVTKPKAEETTATVPTLNHPPPPIPTVTTTPCTTQTPTSTVSTTAATPFPAATPYVSATTSVPNCNNAARETATAAQATAAPAAPNGRERGEKKLRRVLHTSTVKTKAAAQVSEETKPSSPNGSETGGATVSKPASTTQQLFHPSTFSANLDETYNYLSHHINAYFSSSATKTDEKRVDSGAKSSVSSPGQHTSDLVQVSNNSASEPTPTSAPSSQKKGIGHYLSYSSPSVQAFVGSYIAPLVPKFRAAESKRAAVSVEEKMSEDVQQSVEATVTKEQKAADEKAKRLLLQREKIIARVSVDNRTRALVQSLGRASDVKVYTNRVEDFSYHLMEFPETRGVAVKAKVIPYLLRLRQASDPGLRAAVQEALTLVGHVDPVKARGVRVLTIDGGGLRGLVALQTLHRLESLTGKRVFQLFDYICGVSTGAILGFMLGVFRLPLSECDDLYRKLGSDVFKQNLIVGTVKMGWSHAFYDSEAWENILKEHMGADLMVETSRDPNCPKVAAVSTIVNRGLPLKAYVFRNYNLLPGVRSHYLGGCQHQLWQAVRASSAAPGYFQEFTLGNDLHQDGGLLINNPTALAIHECKCLWPNTPVECVVSLGTGRFESPGKHSTTYTSLKTKLTNIISSATDTEEVHTMLDALLPPDTYFRFNPYMNEEIALDESRHEKLDLLQAEGLRYLDRNELKLQKAAAILTREKGSAQRLAEWARLKAHMFDGPH